MSTFITKKFPTDILQLEHISAQIHAGQYDLVSDNGIVIDDFWDDIIKPEWTVHLKLWPLPAIAKEDAEPVETQSQQLPVDATAPVNVMVFFSRRADVEPAPATKGLPEPDGTKSPDEQRVDVPGDQSHFPPHTDDPENAGEQAEENELVTCPVCKIFQGDKQAVNYHVNFTHYPPEQEGEEDSDSAADVQATTSEAEEENLEAQKPPASTPARTADEVQNMKENGGSIEARSNAKGKGKAADEPPATNKAKPLKVKTASKGQGDGILGLIARSAAAPSSRPGHKKRSSATKIKTKTCLETTVYYARHAFRKKKNGEYKEVTGKSCSTLPLHVFSLVSLGHCLRPPPRQKFISSDHSWALVPFFPAF